MLKPRRANSPAQRVSTPGRFSTSTESVWWVMGCSVGQPRSRTVPGNAERRVCDEYSSHTLLHPCVVILGPLDVDHLGRGAAGGNHRVHLLLVVDAGVDDARRAALQRLRDRG